MESLIDYLIKTNIQVGLTKENIEEAIIKLTKKRRNWFVFLTYNFFSTKFYIFKWDTKHVLNKGGIKMESKVKWFNNEKGYGFIEYKENEDIFVHYSQILQDGYKSLNQGENVYFELIETDKGFQAKNVQASRNVM